MTESDFIFWLLLFISTVPFAWIGFLLIGCSDWGTE